MADFEVRRWDGFEARVIGAAPTLHEAKAIIRAECRGERVVWPEHPREDFLDGRPRWYPRAHDIYEEGRWPRHMEFSIWGV